MLVALSMPRRERASQIKAWLERCMIRKTIVIIIMAAFATNIGRCADHVRGKLYFFSDTGIVAQKVKGGVLLWGRDDLAKGKSWKDADFLVLLRLKDTSRINKGMSGGGGWFKYIGIYRHGNLFTGHRDVPMFEIPTKEEIAQAEYLQQEEEKQRLAEQTKQRRILAEQRRLEDEQRRIREQAEQERVNRELQKQREENDRKLAAERAKAEIEAEKQRQEAARQAEEERKRRYPIEQKQRAEYASVKLGGISFDWKSYVRMQKDLLRYVYSIEVTEKKWRDLQNLQRDKNWLGMLGAIAEREMKDYPNEDNIDLLVKQLRTKEFHLSLKFTHKIRLHSLSGGWWDDSDSILPFNMDKSIGGKMTIYAVNWVGHGRSVDMVYKEAAHKKEEIRVNMKLGRIYQTEGDAALKQVDEELAKEVSAWLDTEPVQISTFNPIPGREKTIPSVLQSSTAEKTSSGTPKTNPKWIACPDCEGSRYISKGQCDKCGGEGKYRTRVTRGIGGRPLGGRMAQCDKCNGKGEIKELCKRCYGHGKVKQ